MKQKKHKKIEPEIIGLLIENDNIIIANPCTIQIDFMQDIINNYKKQEHKKNEVSCFVAIKLPFTQSDLRKTKAGTKTGEKVK